MPPTKNRRWIWYFVILVVLTLAATVTLIVYNLSQQLKPEELAAARQLWKEKGPKDYTLVFKKKINEGDETEQFLIKVRGGHVVEGYLNGKAIPESMHHNSMDKMFSHLERFLEMSQEKGARRTYLRAIFDPNTGAILWYVRRVMNSRERVEITVEKLEQAK